jgi:hypothetical protein
MHPLSRCGGSHSSSSPSPLAQEVAYASTEVFSASGLTWSGLLALDHHRDLVGHLLLGGVLGGAGLWPW